MTYFAALTTICIMLQLDTYWFSGAFKPEPAEISNFYLQLYGNKFTECSKYLTTKYPSVNIMSTWISILHNAKNKIDKFDLGIFIGVLRAEAKTIAPKPWINALSNMSFRRDSMFIDDINSFCNMFKTAYGPYVRKELKCDIDRNGNILKNGIKLINIADRKFSDTFPAIPECIEVAISGDLIILVIYFHDGARGSVVAISNISGNIIWESSTFALNTMISAGPGFAGPTHTCQAVIEGNKVSLYGICKNSVYYESYSIDKGKSLVKFSSNLWITDLMSYTK